MKPHNRQSSRRSSWQWLAGLMLIGVTLSIQCSDSKASDLGDEGAMPPSGRSRWWHAIWFHKDSTPRYGKDFENLSRPHERRLKVAPPYCPPGYGYHQPCWRQLPVAPRCATCEMVTGDYAVPYEMPAPTAFPPPPALPRAEPVKKTPDYTEPVPEVVPPVLPAPKVIEKSTADQAGAWVPTVKESSVASAATRAYQNSPSVEIQLTSAEVPVSPEANTVSPELLESAAKTPAQPTVPEKKAPAQTALKPLPATDAVDLHPVYRLSNGPTNSDEPEVWLIRTKLKPVKSSKDDSKPPSNPISATPTPENASPANSTTAQNAIDNESSQGSLGVWMTVNSKEPKCRANLPMTGFTPH